MKQSYNMASSQEILIIALIITLSSNAVLLLLLLLKTPSSTHFQNQDVTKLDQVTNNILQYYRRGTQFIFDTDGKQMNKDIMEASHHKALTRISNNVLNGQMKDYTLLDILTQCEHLQNTISAKNSDIFGVEKNFRNHIRFMDDEIQYHKDRAFRDRNLMSRLFRMRKVSSSKTRNHVVPTHTKTSKHSLSTTNELGSEIARTQNSYPSQLNLSQLLGLLISDSPHKRIKKQAGILPSKEKETDVLPNEKSQDEIHQRDKKQTDALPGKAESPGKQSRRVHEIFSTFTDKELEKFDSAVYDILIPALIHFETMIIREFESLHSVIVAHDLRLENLENTVLNIVNGNSAETQSDSTDNKSDPNSPLNILEEKDGTSGGNISEVLEVHLEVDGSGDGDWGVTQTTLSPSTAVPHVIFYDIYRIVGTMEQKVMALENYNVMSDSELSRVRSEVIKMDDKVTELDRRQRNLQIRTAMHTQKITELEVYMSKGEMGIQTALDSYSRVNSRLDVFKDKLAEFKNDLQSVAAQFGRHDQITNELRAADSYKAHDIQEIRKSVFGIEGRLNGLYRALDHNLDTVRNDLRTMLDRLCINNKLAC